MAREARGDRHRHLVRPRAHLVGCGLGAAPPAIRCPARSWISASAGTERLRADHRLAGDPRLPGAEDHRITRVPPRPLGEPSQGQVLAASGRGERERRGLRRAHGVGRVAERTARAAECHRPVGHEEARRIDTEQRHLEGLGAPAHPAPLDAQLSAHETAQHGVLVFGGIEQRPVDRDARVERHQRRGIDRAKLHPLLRRALGHRRGQRAAHEHAAVVVDGDAGLGPGRPGVDERGDAQEQQRSRGGAQGGHVHSVVPVWSGSIWIAMTAAIFRTSR